MWPFLYILSCRKPVLLVFRDSCCMCSCSFSVSMGRGELRIFLLGYLVSISYKFLFWNTSWHRKKFPKCCNEFLHTLHPASLNVNILNNQSTIIKNKKITWKIPLTDPHILFPFYQLSHQCPFTGPLTHIAFICPISLVSSNPGQFLNLFKCPDLIFFSKSCFIECFLFGVHLIFLLY